ncbi:MAG: NfeD family protein, partial [Flavobacteriales bacterium]|nr:NfeD family protein [Flavobacteriales bacterium]
MPQEIMTAFFTVMLSSVMGFFGSLYLAKKLLTTSALSSMVLASVQNKADGYVGVSASEAQLVGKEGVAFTVLRPSGKVQIDDEIYDATALMGFIDKGEAVIVSKYETAQLFVRKVSK